MADPSQSHLFAYGTLMFPEVWRHVTGRPFAPVRARLSGYRIFRVRGAVFPGVLRSDDPSDQVGGMVFSDLPAEAVARLDAYEDVFYQRVTEQIDGLACQVYVVPPASRLVLTNEAWCADAFERDHLGDFVRRLGG